MAATIRRAARRLGLRSFLIIAIASVLSVAVVVLDGRLSGSAIVAKIVQVKNNNPHLTSEMSAFDSTLPWPMTGGAAYYVPALGASGEEPGAKEVAIASITKVMTAYVVLRDHPLAPGETGPMITMTPRDIRQYETDMRTTQSYVDILAGEQLTERQLLEGLLIHSSDDFAYALALWDAGSLEAFVEKMNQSAHHLGMEHSHFVDASGNTKGDVALPSDVLKVAAKAIAIPLVATLVTKTTVTLPISGLLPSYTPMLWAKGVVGMKSGYTTTSLGCDLLAYRSTVDGRSILVLSIVTGQTTNPRITVAGENALRLAQAVASQIRTVDVLPVGTEVATAYTVGTSVPLRTTKGVQALALPGEEPHRRLLVAHRPTAGALARSAVGVEVVSVGTQVVKVPVVTAGRLGSPSLWQRLW